MTVSKHAFFFLPQLMSTSSSFREKLGKLELKEPEELRATEDWRVRKERRETEVRPD